MWGGEHDPIQYIVHTLTITGSQPMAFRSFQSVVGSSSWYGRFRHSTHAFNQFIHCWICFDLCFHYYLWRKSCKSFLKQLTDGFWQLLFLVRRFVGLEQSMVRSFPPGPKDPTYSVDIRLQSSGSRNSQKSSESQLSLLNLALPLNGLPTVKWRSRIWWYAMRYVIFLAYLLVNINPPLLDLVARASSSPPWPQFRSQARWKGGHFGSYGIRKVDSCPILLPIRGTIWRSHLNRWRRHYQDRTDWPPKQIDHHTSYVRLVYISAPFLTMHRGSYDFEWNITFYFRCFRRVRRCRYRKLARRLVKWIVLISISVRSVKTSAPDTIWRCWSGGRKHSECQRFPQPWLIRFRGWRELFYGVCYAIIYKCNATLLIFI